MTNPFLTPYGLIKSIRADYVKQSVTVTLEFLLRDFRLVQPAWVELATGEKRINVTVTPWEFQSSLLEIPAELSVEVKEP